MVFTFDFDILVFFFWRGSFLSLLTLPFCFEIISKYPGFSCAFFISSFKRSRKKNAFYLISEIQSNVMRVLKQIILENFLMNSFRNFIITFRIYINRVFLLFQIKYKPYREYKNTKDHPKVNFTKCFIFYVKKYQGKI